MDIRNMKLESGWYPKDSISIKEKFKQLELNYKKLKFDFKEKNKNINLSILPHAGWFFTEDLIFNNLKLISELNPQIDVIIIIGGHQDDMGVPIILNYKYLSTPLGNIECLTELIDKIKVTFNMKDENDYMFDNTIEIFLPFIKYLFPNSKIVSYYPLANEKAFLISDYIYNELNNNRLNFIAIGSADLTHYGPNYGFSPAGVGPKSFEWAKENDFKLINYCLKLDLESILANYKEMKFTCSPNSIISIINFAKLLNKNEGFLIEYSNSYLKMKSSSFVGYASIVF
ncbi:MAG: AmmeMemoRadiSam system protein B [Spirochaetes bacterium]|nr:AmmeMemoRadiSam system protein B [Spirochaetota bacterium]